MSGPPERLVVVDTNVFLHYKLLDQLDWSGLGAAPLVLVVLPVVLRELEKVKAVGPTARIRERAAKVVTWLSSLLDSGFEVPLRRDLKLRFETQEPSIDFKANQLAHEIQDDHVIAGVLSLVGSSGVLVALATADIGLKVKAKQRGFAVFCPAEFEKLAEEPDPRYRELQELRKEAQQLKSRIPRLSIRFQSDESKLKFVHPPVVSPPSTLESVKREHPLVGEPQRTTQHLLAAGLPFLNSAAQRERYNNALEGYYADWARYLDEHSTWRRHVACCVALPLIFHNEGTAVATDIEAAFVFPEDLLVFTKEKLPKAPRQPTAPELPTIQNLLGIGRQDFIGSLRHPLHPGQVPDWYWGSDAHRASLRLNRLKHHSTCEVGMLWVQYPSEEAVRSVGLTVRLTAAELPMPVEQKLHLVLV